MNTNNRFSLISPTDIYFHDEGKKGQKLIMTIDGQYRKVVTPKSRLDQELKEIGPEAVKEHVKGGTMFVDNRRNEIIDMRFNDYRGYKIDASALDEINDHLLTDEYNLQQKGSHLIATFPKSEFHIDGYGDGGSFDSMTTISFSPFVTNLVGVLDIIRLICANGMSGTVRELTAPIPIVNRWQDHLMIAASAIKRRGESALRERITGMGRISASVADTQLIAEHAIRRRDTAMNDSERQALQRILIVASPELHCKDVYTPHVFDNKEVGSQLPSHLSKFTAWNLITEMASHTSESPNSSRRSLDFMANKIVFDKKQDNATTIKNHSNGRVVQRVFDNPEQAFFGMAA